uniref:Regulator of G protein signaling 17 n=1 Tax=Cyprinus carpio TaxID=7962 RepID=A0A8C2GY77_CYPCA
VGHKRIYGDEMWKRHTCFLCWCGCCICLWNEDRMEYSERQTCTENKSIETTEDVSWEFLQSEFSEENLMFWIACEELKKDTNQSTNAEKARIIYQNYILIFSLNKVSLDSQVREDIIRSLIDPSSMMYDETQLQIYTLVCRDSFLQFLKSLVYRKHFNSKIWISVQPLDR